MVTAARPVVLRPVGTAKRERQKANRQLKKVQDQKAQRNATAKKWGLRIGVGVVAALGAMLLVANLRGDDAPPSSTVPGGTLIDPTDTTLLSTSSVPASVGGGTTVAGSTAATTDSTVAAASTSAP
jgi:hypothetical protein